MRLGIVSLNLLLCATLAWAGTLMDDFSDGDLDEWVAHKSKENTGRWQVNEGKLTCTNPSNWACALVIGETSWKDYSIECEVVLQSKLGTWALIALLLRFEDKPNLLWRSACLGYGFRSDRPVGAHIVIFDDPNWLQDITNPMAFEIGRKYRLKGIASGNRYQLYIDDKLAIEIKDAHFSSGQVGLGVNGAIALFDNVVITGPDVPDRNLSVEPAGKLATTWGRVKGF